MAILLNKNIQNNNEFQTFVKEIKERILSSQYEALKKVNKKLQTLSREIDWSHNVAIFRISLNLNMQEK